MTTLWEKTGVEIVDEVQTFLAGADVILDRHLLPFDIDATAAHVRGLGRIDCLEPGEVTALVGALDELRTAYAAGEFVLDDRYEDGHTAIEQFLTERLGPVGRKVHLGRSRNDQVLVAIRLWMLDTLGRVREATRRAAAVCLDRAAADARTPMPGYTHLQRAMPSSVGLWLAGAAESFLDDVQLIDLTTSWLATNPLGTASGYGVNLPLDRDGVGRDLGLSRLQLNPVHAQNSRGKHEVQFLTACWQVLQTVRRLAWDLSLFTTSEFAFVRLPARFTTGSSMMPNKRNPDVVELLRAAASELSGRLVEIQSVLGLPSGYHRDLQRTKGAVIEGGRSTLAAIQLVSPLIEGIELDREHLSASIDRTMFATDQAVDLARSGVPFRDAYRILADEVATDDPDVERTLAERVSPGGPGDLRLDELRARLERCESEVTRP